MYALWWLWGEERKELHLTHMQARGLLGALRSTLTMVDAVA